MAKDHIGDLATRPAPNENRLRPQKWDGFIGQKELVQQLRTHIMAASIKGSVPEHILLSGPPGTGKTSLARLCAHEMGQPFKPLVATAIDCLGDLAAVLLNITEGTVILLDEIHRIPKSVQESLYQAMEDYNLTVRSEGEIVTLSLAKFCLIGTTTEPNLLAKPLHDRFALKLKLRLYEPYELTEILKCDAAILGIEADEATFVEIATRARGTPRIAIHLLKRIHDYALVEKSTETLTAEIAEEAFESMGIDKLGLDDADRRLLHTIISKFGGGPASLSTIAAAMGETTQAILMQEEYLIRLGLIERTPRGRIARDLISSPS